MAEMEVEQPALSIEMLSTYFWNALGYKNEKLLEECVEKVAVMFDGQMKPLDLAKDQINLLTAMSTSGKEFNTLVAKMTGMKDGKLDISLDDLTNAIQKLIKLSQDSKMFGHYERKADSSLIETFVRFMKSDVEKKDPLQGGPSSNKRYAELAKQDPEFLMFVFKQMHIISNRILLLASSSVWSYYLKKVDTKSLIKLWQTGLENIDFSVDGKSPILMAAQKKKNLLFKFLIYKWSLQKMEENDVFECLKYAIDDDDTSIAEAILTSFPEEIREILIKKAVIPPHNRTILHVSAEQKNLRIVKLLCKFGAMYNQPDDEGTTPAQLCKTDEDLLIFFNKIKNAFQKAEEKCFEYFNEIDEDKKKDREEVWNTKDFENKKSVIEFLFRKKNKN